MTERSPKLLAQSWGQIDVEGYAPFKDAKLFPGGAREWDWRETGTKHVPGVQPADAAELLEEGAKIVILSQGVQSVLKVPAATVKWLEEQGVVVEVLPTTLAVARYRQLSPREAVGALLHSTC